MLTVALGVVGDAVDLAKHVLPDGHLAHVKQQQEPFLGVITINADTREFERM